MIPVRDTVRAQTYPLVNHALIGVNILVFLVQMAQGPELQRFIYEFGLVPARYSVPAIRNYFSAGEQLFALLSFMFLHGGFWHLLGNLWSLYIFGDNVEDRLGPLRYGLFYLLCGLASGLSHMLLNRYSNVPTIGASGAIAGVMGAYFLLFPHARILTLIPIVFIPYFIEIPAFFFLGLWFLLQFLNAAGSGAAGGGVAWWAHIGGFVFGMMLLKILQSMPATGASAPLRRAAARRSTERLHLVRPEASEGAPQVYGTITVSPREARLGASKLVAVSAGPKRRVLRLKIPAGVAHGTLLRLRGMGGPEAAADAERGDLLLRVTIGGGNE
jgi:hypothetical protein